MKLKDLQNLSYSQEELLVNNEFNYRIRVGFLGLTLIDEKTNKDILDSSDLLGVKRVKENELLQDGWKIMNTTTGKTYFENIELVVIDKKQYQRDSRSIENCDIYTYIYKVKVIDEGEDAGVYTIKINKESKNTKEYLKKTAMDLYKKDMFRDKDNIKIGEVL